MFIWKHLKIKENYKRCLPERKWQQILLKMGFLGPKKKSKEGRKVVELELFEKLEWLEKYFENRSEIKIIW